MTIASCIEVRPDMRTFSFFAALLAVIACAASPGRAAPSSYLLKTNAPISLSSAGPLVAIARGLFQREGLDVKLVGGTSDDDAIDAVAASDNTIGLASAAAFLKARSAGRPIVAFAASYAVSSVEFIALKKTKMVAPSDLEGKRIGYRPGPEFQTVLQAFVAKNSIAQSSLQLIETETPLDDLLSGKIDVLIGYRDVDGERLESMRVDYYSLSPDAYGIHFPGPVFLANASAFANSLDLQKILVAISEGWNTAYSDYDKSGPIIANAIQTEIPRALIPRLMDSQRRLLRPFGARFGEMDVRSIKVLQNLLLQKRIMKDPVDLKLSINEDILTDVYRAGSRNPNRLEP